MSTMVTAREAAELEHVSVSTWRSYVARIKTCPQPKEKIGPLNLWSRAEVEEWVAARPGSGNWRNGAT